MSDILIIGAGAVGSYLAASLHASGAPVTVMARNARLAELRDQGIRFSRGGATEVHRVRVVSPDDQLAPFAHVILCGKTPDLSGALAGLQRWADHRPVVLTTQNGVDAPDQVAWALPLAVVGASRLHGFFELDGGVVRHVGVPPSLAMGAWQADGEEPVQKLGAILTRAGIPVTISSDIRVDLWSKQVLAGSMGGVGALLGLPAGGLRSDPDNWQLLRSAMEEIEAVGRGEGIALSRDIVAATMDFVASFPAEATTSLQRDIVAGRLSEFDALVTSVWRRGRKLGLDMPVLQRLVSTLAPSSQ